MTGTLLAAKQRTAERGTGRRAWSAIEPFHLLVPVAATAALLLSMRPVGDPDVYWHVRLGSEILRHGRLTGAGWSLFPPVHPWKSPEWLAEITLRTLVTQIGWRGLLVYQVVLAVILLVGLAVVIVRGRPGRPAAVVYAICAITLAPYIQARPQTLSLVFLVWLGAKARTLLLEGRLPAPIPFLVLTCLWAQFHGLWIFAPATIVLAALVRLLDSRSGDDIRTAKRAVLLGVGATVAGCINPLGYRSLLLPVQLHAATHTIAEWRPTTFMPYFTWGLLILVALLVSAWVRSTRPVPRAEMAWVAIFSLFALLAFRNVAVTVLMLAPVAVDRLSLQRRQVPTTSREARALTMLTAIATVIAIGTAVVTAATVPPLSTGAPIRLASMLNDGSPHRVLNDYNVGGMIIEFGGTQTRVAVDGRADYYGAAYLTKYSDMMTMRAGWQRLFARINPDRALIGTDGPLHAWLLEHGWRQLGRQGAYSLLARP